MNAQDRIEMVIGKLREHGVTDTLELRSKDGEWVYPLCMDPATVRDLAREFEGKDLARGSVRDILANTIKNLGAKLTGVHLSAAPRGRTVGEIVFEHEGKETVMPARPADAVALARRSGAPIYVNREALERDGLKTSATAEDIAKLVPGDNLARWIRGFRAMGRIDDAILATRRRLELEPKNESWCGILGELYAKKGWLKRAAQEYARSMMWFMREGYMTHAVNSAKEIAALDFEKLGPKKVDAPATLEDFESPEFNNQWLAGGDVVDSPEGAEGKAYRDSFNLAEDRHPWFILSLLGTQVWRKAKSLVVEVHLNLKAGKLGRPLMTCSLDLHGTGDKDWIKGPELQLKQGWNKLVFPLNEKVWIREGNKTALSGETIGPVINVVLVPGGLDPTAVGELCYSKISLEA